MADQPSKNLILDKNFLNSPEYKRLPMETQLRLTEFVLQKKIDLSTKEQEYLLEHLSSNRDINAYLNFLEQQNQIQANSKGANITYNSYETKTPTGKISSKTTTATASSGCLLPILSFLLIWSLL